MITNVEISTQFSYPEKFGTVDFERDNSEQPLVPVPETFNSKAGGKLSLFTPETGSIRAAGNITEFVRGQSWYGEDDLNSLCGSAMFEVADLVGHSPTREEIDAWVWGNINIHNITSTKYLKLADKTSPDEWLDRVATTLNYNREKFLPYTRDEDGKVCAIHLSHNHGTVSVLFCRVAESSVPPRVMSATKGQLLQCSVTFKTDYLRFYGLTKARAWSDNTASKHHYKELGKLEFGGHKACFKEWMKMASSFPGFESHLTHLIHGYGQALSGIQYKLVRRFLEDRGFPLILHKPGTALSPDVLAGYLLPIFEIRPNRAPAGDGFEGLADRLTEIVGGGGEDVDEPTWFEEESDEDYWDELWESDADGETVDEDSSDDEPGEDCSDDEATDEETRGEDDASDGGGSDTEIMDDVEPDPRSDKEDDSGVGRYPIKRSRRGSRSDLS